MQTIKELVVAFRESTGESIKGVATRVIRSITNKSLRQQGVTVIEVLVAGVVVIVGLIFIAQFFTSTAQRVLASDTRSLMSQIGTQEIESIRAMQYGDVGTVGGMPSGLLATQSTKQVQDPTTQGIRTFKIERQVTYYTDPSYSGPYPANYRRATVIITSVDNPALKPVTMSTNVAGGALGGTLDITVTDRAGHGVPNAQLTITDTLLSPNVLINASAIHTDDDGHLQVPGLTPDANGGYFVRADKTGYNSAALKTGQVVTKGVTTSVQLTIDLLATMVIHLTDPSGVAQAGVSLTVTGYQSISPWTYSQTVTTDSNGYATLSNIRYSWSVEPYFIQLTNPVSLLELPDGVDAPEIDDSFGTLPAGKIPVVLDPGETQPVDLWVSNAPVITSISPTSGTVYGGTTVTINGARFTGATAVKFGTTDAASFTINSSTKITATAPAGWGLGIVDVTVTTPNGTSEAVSADQYSYYLPAPTVTGVNPTTGVKGGGTTVIITGTNFSSVTAVKFDTTNATSFTVNSTTQITAVAPPHANGTIHITVTNSSGTSSTSSADQYKYVTKV